MPCTSGISGRRKLAFEDSREKSKSRKLIELRKTVGISELTEITQSN
jgi:hypothetical protein